MPYKRSLTECLEPHSIAVTGSSQSIEQVDELPTLDTSGWISCLNVNKSKGGKAIAVLEPLQISVVYRAADGDRSYPTESPTLRSLATSNGKQGGSGAMKVREYQGKTYHERPMTAREYENLMGWESGSTEFGITEDGKAIAISQTQRKKMLGNGIIPQEITEILTALKPILEVIKE